MDKINERILENEAEWRRYIVNKLDTIEREQKNLLVVTTTLKVKIGIASTLFGAVGAAAWNLLSSFVGKGH